MCPDDQRRIDRILHPDYLMDLSELSADELRQRRAECREEEEILSFCRRLLHGKLDILRAELEARRNQEKFSGQEMVDRLAAILGAGSSAGGASRGARTRLPSKSIEAAGRRRAERVASESHLVRLPELGPDEMQRTVDELVAEERLVSEERRRVHAVIDGLDAELMRRYQEGGISPPGIRDSGTN